MAEAVLTPDAERAIRNYMLRQVAIPGAIGAVLLFFLGFFINEVARGTAYNAAYKDAATSIMQVAGEAGKAANVAESASLSAKAAQGVAKRAQEEIEGAQREVSVAKDRAQKAAAEAQAAVAAAQPSMNQARILQQEARELAKENRDLREELMQLVRVSPLLRATKISVDAVAEALSTDEKFKKQLGLAPAGAILPYAGNQPPPGWLLCDGHSVNAKDYPALATVLGAGAKDATVRLWPSVFSRRWS